VPTTLSTLQSFITARHTIHAHHDVLGEHPCSHYALLDLKALADKLGPDFDVVENHDWFVAQLVCTECKRRGNMSIIIKPPGR